MSDSKLYMSLSYGLDKYSLSESCTSRIQEESTESDILIAELVLDFLGIRSKMPDDAGINDVIKITYYVGFLLVLDLL